MSRHVVALISDLSDQLADLLSPANAVGGIVLMGCLVCYFYDQLLPFVCASLLLVVLAPFLYGSYMLACYFSCCGAGSFAMRRAFRRIALLEGDKKHAAITDYINRFGTRHPRSQQWRSSFRGVHFTPFTPPGNHTHAIAANMRSVGSRTCASIVEQMGMRPFYYQCSYSDVKYGYEGSRQWFWSKDLHIPCSPFEMDEQSVPILVDVDYYVDMPEFLATYHKPVLLYTFQPSVPCAQRENYSFYCRDNVFHTDMAGGGMYEHPLWNYNQDGLIAKRKNKDGTYHYVSYEVERRQVDDDHMMVLLVPVMSWDQPTEMEYIAAPKFHRYEVTSNDFCVIVSQEQNVNYTTISENGGRLSAKVRSDVLSGLHNIQHATTLGLICAGVQRECPELSMGQAALVLRYVRQLHHIPLTSVFPVEHASRGYSLKDNNHDFDAKPALVAYMCPFVHEGFNPTMQLSTEEVAIKERITDIACNTTMTIAMRRYADEFVKCVFPDTLPKLVPYGDQEVYDRQNNPSQRALLKQVGQSYRDTIQSFIKREAYGDIHTPRVISTINPTIKNGYSRFMYAVSDHIIDTAAWYAFGHTTRDVAERVANICQGAVNAVSTDLSRFDGRLSPACREFEMMLLKQMFGDKFYGEVLDMHERQYNLPGWGKFGTKYDTGTSRASGSPETAIFNSLVNALLAYCVIRKHNADKSAAWCYTRLGIYGGDDGLTPNVDPKLYEKTCAEWGQKLTAETYAHGSRGVNFLARIYSPLVWNGCMDSMCDVRRAITKFHLSVQVPATNMQKLQEKSFSYFLSDANTPFLGDFVRVVLEKTKHKPATEYLQVLWNYQTMQTQLHGGQHYPNNYGEWMLEEVNMQMPDFNSDALYEWLEKVAKDTEPESSLLKPPLMVELSMPVTERKVIVDGVLHPEKKKEVKPTAKPTRRGRRSAEKQKERKSGRQARDDYIK